MKSIALFILFVGIILIINSYYENKYITKQNETKTIIKYVPLSQYEETLTDEESLTQFYKGMFELTQPNIYDVKKI
jgi:hypothetical protein